MMKLSLTKIFLSDRLTQLSVVESTIFNWSYFENNDNAAVILIRQDILNEEYLFAWGSFFNI